MPSGAKKRKAIKKKKEAHGNNSAPKHDNDGSNANTQDSDNAHENDEVRSQDEKDSDGGETGSPAGRRNQPSAFNGGSEELNKEDPSTVRSVVGEKVVLPVEDSEIIEKGVVDGNGSVQSVEEVKYEDNSEIPVEYVEPVKEQDDNKSDGEGISQANEKKFEDEERDVQIESTQFTDLAEPDDSLSRDLTQVLASAPVESFGDVTLVEQVDSLREKVDIETALSGSKVDCGFKSSENEDKLLPADEEAQQISSSALDLGSKNVEIKVFPVLDECTGSEIAPSASKTEKAEVFPSSEGLVTQKTNDLESAKDNEISESSEDQPLVETAPKLAKRTSWMSCCGLFDVITGSGR